RCELLGGLLHGRAPPVGAEPLLLLDERAEPLQVRPVGADQSLQADVLVRPQRPAGLVPVVDLQLVAEDLVALPVQLRIPGVDGAELADPERGAGLALEPRPLLERALQLVPVTPAALGVSGITTPVGEPGEGVVVTDEDGVLV